MRRLQREPLSASRKLKSFEGAVADEEEAEAGETDDDAAAILPLAPLSRVLEFSSSFSFSCLGLIFADFVAFISLFDYCDFSY